MLTGSWLASLKMCASTSTTLFKEGEALSAASPAPQIGGRWCRRPRVSYGISGQLTGRGPRKNRLSSGLPNRLSVIFSGIWDRARRGVL